MANNKKNTKIAIVVSLLVGIIALIALAPDVKQEGSGDNGFEDSNEKNESPNSPSTHVSSGKRESRFKDIENEINNFLTGSRRGDIFKSSRRGCLQGIPPNFEKMSIKLNSLATELDLTYEFAEEICYHLISFQGEPNSSDDADKITRDTIARLKEMLSKVSLRVTNRTSCDLIIKGMEIKAGATRSIQVDGGDFCLWGGPPALQGDLLCKASSQTTFEIPLCDESELTTTDGRWLVQTKPAVAENKPISVSKPYSVNVSLKEKE